MENAGFAELNKQNKTVISLRPKNIAVKDHNFKSKDTLGKWPQWSANLCVPRGGRSVWKIHFFIESGLKKDKIQNFIF